jgi:dihydrofolate synthase / folylpolyglutamate synthase
MKTFSTLSAWVEYLQTNNPVEIEMGLARIGKVSRALGLRFNCPIVTVGGTNGKGSACAMLEAILLEAGYKVGCYTSPHFLLFNERVRINGQMVTDTQLLPHFEAIERVRCSLLEPVALTHFEFITLAAMRLFATSGLNAIILEVGLGGRLDAVNIVDTDCAIVTSVDIDHTQHLGNTRERIGFEKAGIFRPGRPAICGDPAAPDPLIAHAKRIGADLWLLGRDFNHSGNQQQWNYVCLARH